MRNRGSRRLGAQSDQFSFCVRASRHNVIRSDHALVLDVSSIRRRRAILTLCARITSSVGATECSRSPRFVAVEPRETALTYIVVSGSKALIAMFRRCDERR